MLSCGISLLQQTDREGEGAVCWWYGHGRLPEGGVKIEMYKTNKKHTRVENKKAWTSRFWGSTSHHSSVYENGGNLIEKFRGGGDN